MAKAKVAKKTIQKVTEKPPKITKIVPIDATNVPVANANGTIIKFQAKGDELLKKYKYRRVKLPEGSTIEVDTDASFKAVCEHYKEQGFDIADIYAKQMAPSKLGGEEVVPEVAAVATETKQEAPPESTPTNDNAVS